nr:cytochrome P450 [Tamarix hispida]
MMKYRSSFMLANLTVLLPVCLVIIIQRTSWPLCLVVFSSFSFFYFLLRFWLVPGGFAWRKHERSANLRGPVGWPLLGILPEMGPLAHRKLASLAASMGALRLMALSLGTIPLIISSHPETAKEILCSPSFSDRPVKASARLLMFERAIGFSPSGKYWRRLRRIAATCMFSSQRISSLEGLRLETVDEMVASVLEEMEVRGAVELRGILRKGSLSNILNSIFGTGLGSKEERLGSMIEEGYELISGFNWEDYFPCLDFLDFRGVKRRCCSLANNVNELIGEIIKDRKKDEGLGSRNDYLSVLLSLPADDQLSDSDMVAVLWEMVFRGTDTIAILLEWIMARMILHQDIQSKAQQELDRCIGNQRRVQDSDVPNLLYLQAIVKEVLRLHPPGPLLSWARLAVHDVYVDKVRIPAGTTAMVNMWAITHDPSVWKDPCAFKPERFLDGEDVSVMGSDLRLAPFGSGRRVCPGRAMGLATVHLWLARLLHRFKWVPAKQCPVDLAEQLRLSLEMKRPLAACVIER